jgi:hypothetical protein
MIDLKALLLTILFNQSEILLYACLASLAYAMDSVDNFTSL